MEAVAVKVGLDYFVTTPFEQGNFIAFRLLETIMSHAAKQARLELANQLIAIIAAHGRQFFRNSKDGFVSRLELDERGKVWFIDYYSKKRIYTHPTTFTNRWQGFSSGGTLRNLVENMRDFVTHDRKLHPDEIATPYRSGDGTIWGYDDVSAKAVRAAAHALPMFVDVEKPSDDESETPEPETAPTM